MNRIHPAAVAAAVFVAVAVADGNAAHAAGVPPLFNKGRTEWKVVVARDSSPVIRYAADHVLDYIALDSEYSIYDVSVPQEWDGKTVGSLDIRRKYGLNVLAIRGRGSSSMVVTSDTVLSADQTILVLGRWKDVQRCFRI